jgi:hypothetical protein
MIRQATAANLISLLFASVFKQQYYDHVIATWGASSILRDLKTVSDEPFDPDYEADISNDPLLSALNRDLERATRKIDRRLLLIIGLPLLVAIALKVIRLPHWAVYVLAALAAIGIVGSISFTTWLIGKRTKAVARRYGLNCKACGQQPDITQLLDAANFRQCPHCNASLDVHLPQRRRRK